MRVFCILMIFAGCPSSQPADEPPPPTKKTKKKRPVRARPGSPPGQAELEAAVSAAKNDDLDTAIEHCKAAIAKNAQLEHAYLLYGSACAMKGATCEEEAYERGLSALPKSIPLKKSMALVYLGKNDHAKAIEMLKQANELTGGKDVEILADLAYAHIFVKELDEGERLARKALEIDPKCFQCNMALGEILLVGKKFSGAVDAYARAAELVPEDSAPRRKRAKALYLAGKKKQAFSAYDAELEKAPDDASLRFEYAKILIDAGKGKSAVKHIEKLLEANPDEPNLKKLLKKAKKGRKR